MRRRPLQMLGKHFCALNRRWRRCAAALSRSHIFPMPKANVVNNEVHPSSTCRVCPQVRGKQVSAGIAHLRCQTYKHRDLFSYSTQSSHPPLLLPAPPPFPPPPIHRSPVTPFTFYACSAPYSVLSKSGFLRRRSSRFQPYVITE